MRYTRRRLLQQGAAVLLSLPVLGTLSACVAPRISPLARDPANGTPWRCEHCGHLTRAPHDISGDRCPRCRRRGMGRIEEEEMAQRLAEAES